MIEVVCFDVGETLFDETALWGAWADWLGLPRFAFFGLFGAVIARGEDHRQVFELARPGSDLARLQAARRQAGAERQLTAADVYPDALPCLATLQAAGYRLGIAANQPERTEPLMAGLGIRFDFIASSARWGVAKPAPAFFDRLIAAAGTAPERIAYIGDRLDNDIRPALAAGLRAVHLRRGPWGLIQAAALAAPPAWPVIDELVALPAVIARLDARA